MNRFCLLIAVLLGFAAGNSAAAGRLVIVGGSLERDNTAVFRSFLEGLDETAHIAVIGAASASPVESMQSFAADLAHYGIAPERVIQVQLAWRDDPATAADETAWRDNATDPAEIAGIESADAVWFTGGDQSRIVRVLRNDDGSATPMLAALRARLAAGMVIGGTSAGAAVMSDPMISGGDNLPVLLSGFAQLQAEAAALPLPQPPTVADTSVLSMGRGLGLLPGVLVDQHFSARARLGRLVLALLTRPPAERIGLGIDENTGIAVDLGAGTVEVLGAANVTLVDAGNASINRGTIHGVRYSVLGPGTRLELPGLAVTPPDWQAPLTVEAGDAGDTVSSSAGVAVPAAGLTVRLADDLFTAGGRVVEYLTLQHQPGAGSTARGVVYRFARTPASAGYRGRDAVGRSHSTLLNLEFEIAPVRVAVAPAPPSG